MDNLNKEQLVSLKVMRLLKPSLHQTFPVFVEPEHSTDYFTKPLLNDVYHLSKEKSISSPDCSTTDFLVIPQIFGNLYIGETFTSYICLHNHSVFKVKSLSIKVELQTVTQKIPLPFKSNIDFLEDFDPDSKFDGVVEHDVKELGNHILICVVSYLTEKMEKMQFKKFYKFVVSKPFEIQPRFPFVETRNIENNTVLFEAQIQNITNSILFMEKVELQPLRDNIIIKEIEKKKTEDGYSFDALLRPTEVKQYLYKVIYENIDAEPKPLVIGKLDINWRNSMGEIGHLQTHPLAQNADVYNLNNREIELTFTGFPNMVKNDQVIDFTCNIRNKSERELDLHLKLNSDKSYGYIWNCNLNHEIGKIMPKNIYSIKLSIVPYQLGLLAISGISITDLFLKRLHEFTQVHNFYVFGS